MIGHRLPRLVSVRHVRNHVLWLQFDDGIQGEVELADGLDGEMLESLRDVAMFAEARIEDGVLTWPNGADWAPESLRERLGAPYRFVSQSIDDAWRDQSMQISDVPEISRFYGIVIRMLAPEHGPPHYHATYGEYEVSVSIHDGVVTGRFPKRALRLVLKWHDEHERELVANWERLRAGKAVTPIAPLP